MIQKLEFEKTPFEEIIDGNYVFQMAVAKVPNLPPETPISSRRVE